jgi:hypothetical protein
MPNPFKIKESNHERAIVKRYRGDEWYSIRAPASLGTIDGISFKKDMTVCWASESIPLSVEKAKRIKQEMKKYMPDDWLLLFFYKERNGTELVMNSDDLV